VGFRASVDIRLCVSQSQYGHEAMWVSYQSGETNLWVSEPVWT